MILKYIYGNPCWQCGSEYLVYATVERPSRSINIDLHMWISDVVNKFTQSNRRAYATLFINGNIPQATNARKPLELMVYCYWLVMLCIPDL